MALIRSAMIAAPRLGVLESITMNAPPLYLANRSESRKVAPQKVTNLFRTASPPSWPYVSFISLKQAKKVAKRLKDEKFDFIKLLKGLCDKITEQNWKFYT